MENRNEANKLNNAGFTLVEMVVAFALLALFMVAVTRIISYTVSLYHTTQASANGLEVSGMLSNKLVGLIEGAKEIKTVTDDSITLVDETDTTVTISVVNNYINIHYSEVTTPSGNTLMKSDGTTPYTPDWKFSASTYMGFTVSELKFIHPLPEDYPYNVIKMILTLHNGKYGDNDYTSTSYIKCPALPNEEPSSETTP